MSDESDAIQTRDITPAMLLAWLQEQGPAVKAVSVVVQWEGDTFSTHWSEQKVFELCMGARVFQADIDQMMHLPRRYAVNGGQGGGA